MNASSRRSAERGQVLFIVAAAMIVLIGIAALAIDLGFSWMLRRQEQNAADPAALAAARFISEPDPVTGVQSYDSGNGWSAACHYALMNGFFNASNTGCSAQSDGTSMVVNWPPTSGQFAGDRGSVQVVITAAHDTFFGRIFGKSTASVTTDAVASRQRGNTNSNSLIALKPDGCGTAKVRGNSTISIYPVPGYSGPGGYVQVNSDCGSSTSDDVCNTSASGALTINGGAVLTAPKVNVHGGCSGPGSQPASVLDEASLQIGDPLSSLRFPAWDTSISGARCGVGAAATTSSASQGCGQGGGRIPWKKSADSACPGLPSGYECIELDPGVYYGGWNIGSKVRVTLKPGIYVIAGGGITIGSTGSLDSLGGTSSPAPILIYNTDNPIFASTCPSAGASKCQQNLDLTAQVDLKLAGLRADAPCPPVTTSGGCPFGGMLIWYDGQGSQAASASGIVDMEGGGTLDVSGTIYAPRTHVDITGNVDTNCTASPTQIAAVQIVAWTWDIGGTGDLCMPYDPSKLYKLSQQGLVE
jgi:hypothetical protein